MGGRRSGNVEADFEDVHLREQAEAWLYVVHDDASWETWKWLDPAIGILTPVRLFRDPNLME
jgi:hypothetical protein